MPKIILQREKCIGCGSCVVLCPKFWKMSEDGKSQLLNSKKNPKTGNWELEVKDIHCNQDAVDVCPVQIIHIEK